MTPRHRTGMFDLPHGTELGKYQVLRRLATGGMAEIYLAKVRGTAGFEKLVVLKRILPHVAEDPAFVGMFLDEARLAATLQHPNIADVHDVGEADGAPFFAMEYVHGQDVRSIKLAARGRGEPVPLAIGLAIIHGTASALDYAHDKVGPDGLGLGLVHRDVSSTNVMVSYDGAIKLLDFGIARATGRRHKTETGTLKGKVPYMSPEQCRGQALDRRSDLFSLGVVMFELTVGRRPFRGDSDFDIMDQIVNHQAPAPSSIVRGYPEQLELMVGKLLAREPAQRYQTAEDFLHDLEPFIAQHQLWVSPKPLGKYMRRLFADRIAAWEQAMQSGLTLDDLLAEVTEQRKSSSDLLATPAALPALLPMSQQMHAVHELEHSTPLRLASELPAPPAAPPIAPRSSRGRRVVSVLAGLLLGAAGIAAYYVWSEQPRQVVPEVVEPVPQAAQPPSEPRPEPEPEPEPEPAIVGDPKPPPAATAEAEIEIEVPVTRPPEPRPPAVKSRSRPAHSAKPPKPDPGKEPTWDPNSPFLPPSR